MDFFAREAYDFISTISPRLIRFAFQPDGQILLHNPKARQLVPHLGKQLCVCFAGSSHLQHHDLRLRRSHALQASFSACAIVLAVQPIARKFISAHFR